MDDILEEAKTAIAAEMPKTEGVGIAIPWELLIGIAIQIIQGCMKPPKGEEIKAAANNPGFFLRLRGNAVVRKNLGWGASHAEVVATRDAMFAAAAKADPAKLDSFAAAAAHM